MQNPCFFCKKEAETSACFYHIVDVAATLPGWDLPSSVPDAAEHACENHVIGPTLHTEILIRIPR